MAHGLSIPIGKLGYHLSVPRFLSRAVDAESRNLPVKGTQYEGQIRSQGDPQYPERRTSEGPQRLGDPVRCSLGLSRIPGTGIAHATATDNLESVNSSKAQSAQSFDV